jgi:hypothetical protein
MIFNRESSEGTYNNIILVSLRRWALLGLQADWDIIFKRILGKYVPGSGLDFLIQNKDRWQVQVDTVMNLQVPNKARDILNR